MAVNLIRNSSPTALCITRINFYHAQAWKRQHAAYVLNINIEFARKKPIFQNSVIFKPITAHKILIPGVASSHISFNQTHDGSRSRKKLRLYSSTPQNKPGIIPQNQPNKENDGDDDDLKAILKDKSLSLTAKFKIIFKQYGLVMIGVHILTSAIWIAIFYTAVNRGVDITPFLERTGVFDYMEKWGVSFVDKVRSSGASDYVVTYVLYELAKPIRYVVTLFGTMYSVRYLRRKGFMKRPPKSATVSELVQTQGKIVRNRLKRRTKIYTDKYKSKVNRKKNGKGHNTQN